jgi:hypothetical protein
LIASSLELLRVRILPGGESHKIADFSSISLFQKPKFCKKLPAVTGAPLLAARRSLAAQDPGIVASLLALDRKTFVALTKLPF